tara:strand:+ start:936 stop:1328 length:393 start_codon:yes stop_codon:yes gene_type:complete
MPRRKQIPIQKRFAAHLRQRREELGLSQGELAQLAKTSRSQVFELENERKVPSLVTVDNLAKALGAPISALLGEEEGFRANPPGDDAAGIAVQLRDRGPDYVRAVKALIRSLDRTVGAAVERERKAKASG